MAWLRIGDKPLSEPMLTRFTDAYIRHKGLNSGCCYQMGIADVILKGKLEFSFHPCVTFKTQCFVLYKRGWGMSQAIYHPSWYHEFHALSFLGDYHFIVENTCQLCYFIYLYIYITVYSSLIYQIACHCCIASTPRMTLQQIAHNSHIKHLALTLNVWGPN